MATPWRWGAIWESSGATGIDGDQLDKSVRAAGAAYVFTFNGTTWSQQAYIKASNTHDNSEMNAHLHQENFGYSVSLDGTGDRLAVGARWEYSAGTGINGDHQSDNSAPGAGAVYVFNRNAGVWGQQAYVKASNTRPRDDNPPGSIETLFGYSVSLDSSGDTLAVGAHMEDGSATGIDGHQTNDCTLPSATQCAIDSGAGVSVLKPDVATAGKGSPICDPYPFSRC